LPDEAQGGRNETFVPTAYRLDSKRVLGLPLKLQTKAPDGAKETAPTTIAAALYELASSRDDETSTTIQEFLAQAVPSITKTRDATWRAQNGELMVGTAYDTPTASPNRVLADIKTADIEDFIADLKKPRVVHGQQNRTLSPASINRAIELLRHMMNWAVGPRVPRTHSVPARNGNTHSETARRQPTSPTALGRRRSESAGGRHAVSSVDDHHCPGYRHASG